MGNLVLEHLKDCELAWRKEEGTKGWFLGEARAMDGVPGLAPRVLGRPRGKGAARQGAQGTLAYTRQVVR